jgi:DNA-binding NarL/FixJ family response regulator
MLRARRTIGVHGTSERLRNIRTELSEDIMKFPRVLIADDHTLVLEAIRKLLEPRCDVVGTVTDGRALVESAVMLKPDVVLIDIAMPLLNGLEAVRQLKTKVPGMKLICLTMNEDSEIGAEAMRAGASGYLLKKSAASELFYAIQEVLRGRSYVTPEIASGMQERFVRDPRPIAQRRVLTSRQREVMQLLAEGKSLKEAAHVLNVTPRTVAFHKYQIMAEMKLKSTADLIRFAIKNGIVL